MNLRYTLTKQHCKNVSVNERQTNYTVKCLIKKKRKKERRMETVKHCISLMLSFLKSSFKFIFKRCDIVAKAASWGSWKLGTNLGYITSIWTSHKLFFTLVSSVITRSVHSHDYTNRITQDRNLQGKSLKAGAKTEYIGLSSQIIWSQISVFFSLGHVGFFRTFHSFVQAQHLSHFPK